MQARGFEQKSVVASASDIFADLEDYTVAPAYAKAGRDHDAPGPSDVKRVLTTSRYGPRPRCR
jgi:hypothetical protein